MCVGVGLWVYVSIDDNLRIVKLLCPYFQLKVYSLILQLLMDAIFLEL